MEDIFRKNNNYIRFSEISSHLLCGSKESIPTPQVSIVMPVYNHPDYFKQALLSAVNQDYDGEYEIVVVDNNEMSLEPTINQKIIEEINSPKILYYRNDKNIGMFGNFNRGIELARADFITFLHDDDLFLSNALSTLMSIQKKTGCQGVYSAYFIIDQNNKKIIDETTTLPEHKRLRLRPFYKYGLWDSFQGCVVPAGEGAIFVKQRLLDMGGFNPDFYPSSDYAFLSCYTYYNSVCYQTTPIFEYRKAENESLSAYPKYAISDKHVLSCIASKLKVPGFIMRRIVEARMRYQKLHLEVVWGHKDKSYEDSLSFIDRSIIKLSNFLYQISTIHKRREFK